MVPVREQYENYSPPPWVKPTVERLLGSLSRGHVNGLEAIVLTDSGSADARKRRRTRAQKRAQKHGVVLGTYWHGWAGRRPWIEIVVDRVVPEVPRHLRLFKLAREVVFAGVLFHEIGHHLDATVGSVARGDEANAEAWRRRLNAVHFAARYWYLRPVLAMLVRFSRLMARLARSMQREGRADTVRSQNADATTKTSSRAAHQ
jgi:hypothetical protein